MIIAGTAGTDKFFTIDAIITESPQRLEEQGVTGKTVLVMAPTGRAATQAKGYTLHCSEGLSVPTQTGKIFIMNFLHYDIYFFDITPFFFGKK